MRNTKSNAPIEDVINACSEVKSNKESSCHIALPLLPVYVKLKGTNKYVLTYAALDTLYMHAL